MINQGPLAQYQRAIDAGDIREDSAQLVAVQHLQRLYRDVNRPEVERGFVKKLFVRERRPQIRGLYFWGGVGRGKTYLMDVFFETLSFAEKRRMHFHRFMRHVHRQLKILQGEPDPLKKIAAEFAATTRVLCFDEFFVSDITDAMILAGLLEPMFEKGVVLVATSNVEPSHLYENGLQRSRFLPAIELLKKHVEVINVDGGVDYRLQALESAEIYHYPLDDKADVGLAHSFLTLSPDAGEEDVDLEIEGRIIKARKCGDGVVWFDFSNLCEGPRSQNDYIELAMIFQTVLLSNVPRFSAGKENAARRFISLVDEFYDHNVKLILSAEVPVRELYAGELLEFEFQRTMSRLTEMQSIEYLANEHLP